MRRGAEPLLPDPVGDQRQLRLIIGVGLFFISIPPAAMGRLAASLISIYIGALMAGVIPVALGASVDPGWSMMTWAAALFPVTEPIMGQSSSPFFGRRRACHRSPS
jgi:hypothetical protein